MPLVDAVYPEAFVSDELLALVVDCPVPGLDALPRCSKTQLRLEKLLQSASHQPVVTKACQAGLWLLAGELNRSHELSQSLDNSDGSFWHGIMHRREGDFWNAKYWFRRTRNHPVRKLLADKISESTTELLDFGLPIQRFVDVDSQADSIVDCSELALKNRCIWSSPLRQVCWWEWQLLWVHCLEASNTIPKIV